jgi:hypothetical protein
VTIVKIPIVVAHAVMKVATSPNVWAISAFPRAIPHFGDTRRRRRRQFEGVATAVE